MPTILTKKSDTPGAVPATANLTNAAGGAELAVNTADKRLFSINSSSAVIELGTNPSSLTCADASFTVARITSLTISSLSLSNVTVTSATVTTLTGTSANITTVTGTTAGFASANITQFQATSATITTLTGTSANVTNASAGSLTVTSGNLTFSSTGQRITGDMSNATHANRLSFQTSTTNGATSPFVIPNGTGNTASIILANASNPTNCSFLQVQTAEFATNIVAGILGTGSYLPMVFSTGGSEKMRLDTSGNLGIGTASPSSKLSVGGNPPSSGVLAGVSAADSISLALSDNTNNSLYVKHPTGAPATIGTDTGGALAFATNGFTERMRIDSSGNVGIGGTAGADTKVEIVGTLPTSAQLSRGFRVSGTIPSGTTTNSANFQSFPATQAASFTLSNLWGFVASQGTFGAGSTVTNQMGFFATSLLTGATNNYGFYSDIASGSNRWNFYAAGTADNFFAGNVEIGSGSGQRIKGNFSDATKSNRLSFQTNVANTATNIQVIPNGTNTRSSLFLFSDQSANNCSLGAISIIGSSSVFAIESAIEGSGTFLPITFSTSNAERMRITTGGEVYIAGTTDQGAYNLQCNGTGVWGAGAYVNGSDARLKDNIQSLDTGLDVVKAMRPVTFQYKPEYSKDRNVQPGFIAQELQTAMAGKPYLEGVVQEGPNHLNVAYQNIIPILVKAIQELEAKVAALEAK